MKEKFPSNHPSKKDLQKICNDFTEILKKCDDCRRFTMWKDEKFTLTRKTFCGNNYSV